VPGDFKLERGAPDRMFATTVRKLDLAAVPSDWERALAIGRHLLSAVGPHSGGAIQSDLRTTYRRIVQNGQGYCGDFVDVFTGLALAAGIPVRAWAFSFDGFGGDGHIFNEIYDRDAGAWRMIDVFNNYYFVGGDGTPLSALAFREALQRGVPLRIVPVSSSAPPRFKYEEKAWAYYQRGLPQWYQWWGNNVFSYDQTPVVRGFVRVSRSLEQLAAIAVGVHPQIRVLAEERNAQQRSAMHRLRWRLLATALLFVVSVVLGIAYGVARRRAVPS
jgi:hypothetical protein